MRQAVGARRAVRQAHPEDVFSADGAHRQRGRDGGIDTARQADHGLSESPAAHLVAQEPEQPLLDHGRVDIERGRTSVSVARHMERWNDDAPVATMMLIGRGGAKFAFGGGPPRPTIRFGQIVRRDELLLSLHRIERPTKVGERCPQVREQWHVRSRPGDVPHVDCQRHDRLVERRRTDADVAARSSHTGATGKHLSAFAPGEVGQRDEHAMLVGNVTHQPLPPRETPRTRHTLARLKPPRRCRRAHEDHLRIIERGNRSGDAVPRVLADEHRGPAPRRVKGSLRVPTLDEPLFIEEAIRRQEVLAMNMKDASRTIAQPHVGDAVVQVVAPLLVKAHHDIQRTAGPVVLGSVGIRLVEIAGQCAGGDGHVTHAAFHEVAAQHRFREMHDLRMRRQHAHLREDVTQAVQVRAIIALVRVQLHDCNSQ